MELETGEEVKKAPHRELINAVRLAVRAHLMLSKFTQNANRKNTLAPNAVADTTVNCKACQQAGKGNTGKGNARKAQQIIAQSTTPSRCRLAGSRHFLLSAENSPATISLIIWLNADRGST